MTAPSPVLRRAGPGDAAALAACILEGFGTYGEFAPGWSPPQTEAEEAAGLRAELAQEETWSMLAEADGGVAGFALFLPARRARRAPLGPLTAHLMGLFLGLRWHGTGLATRLLGEAVIAAGARGFASMRLFTPAAHARARRFYEREGWEAAGPPFDDAEFGLPLIEYRRALRRGCAGAHPVPHERGADPPAWNYPRA